MDPLPTPRDVLQFWFGDEPLRERAEWFRKDAAFDAQIRERFGGAVTAALQGSLGHWRDTAPGRLALVVVLDQFTRNILRGTPGAFAGDAQALALARQMVDAGEDHAWPPLQRLFIYLPFEHAEDAVVQEHSMRLFTALARDDPSQQGLLDYAVRHRDIVARFGRFPHRNAILGRESTAEEAEFLKQPGSGF
jgi:uncharacterized protein (DUF924 family)